MPRTQSLMPDDPVEKFSPNKRHLSSSARTSSRRRFVQKEAAIKSFDEKLARLGYNGSAKRSHHKPAPETKKSS